MRVYKMSIPDGLPLEYDLHKPTSTQSTANEGDHNSQLQRYQWTYNPSILDDREDPFPSNQCTLPHYITPPRSVSLASSDDRQDGQLQIELAGESPGNEDIPHSETSSDLCLQPNKPHQTAGGQKNQSQNSVFRCPWPQCANTKGFKQQKDLTRHEKKHRDPEFYCGCCRNLGIPFQGLPRRDKLVDHMRKDHQLPGKHSGKPPLDCRERNSHNGQTLLFTTASCVDEHLRQEHSASIAPLREITTCAMISTQMRAGDELPAHDCRHILDASPQRGRPGPDKHPLASPVESTAKRGKYHSTVSGNFSWPDMSSVGPYGMPSPLSNTLMGTEDMDSYSLDAINMKFASDGANPQGLVCETMLEQHSSDESLNNATSAPYFNPGANMPSGITYTQTLTLGIHPVYFLAIHMDTNFSQIEKAILHSTSNASQTPNTKPITYNVREETITLAGDETVIKRTKEYLQFKLSDLLEKGGLKDMLAKQKGPDAGSVSSPRPYVCDAPRIQGRDSGEPSHKVFAIRPKENEHLVKVWMNSILPALPDILSRGLGGTYAASLVRRGSSDITAIPCIQIESPFIPGRENKASIKEALDKICHANGQLSGIQVLFTKGRLQKLFGGPDSDTGGEDSDQQRLHFNRNRPCTNPGMGASLGLMCSKEVTATLGGYILVNGIKYLLTSDHFVERSRDGSINNGVALENRDILVSPSLADVAQMLEFLEQTARDFKARKKSQWQKRLGDRDIQPSKLDPVLSPKIEADTIKLNEITELLDQVKKPDEDFTLGNVFRRSTEPRKALDAQVLGSNYANLTRNMDWAICEVNDRAGENRHKYKSNDDAKEDEYIHENKRTNVPGEICYQTCDIHPAAQVYYVGQKSGHREGTVNGVPTLISLNTVESTEWSILGSQQPIEPQDVEGDSGAWLIRKYDNKLMGQVIAFCNDQIIFTPIMDIFADIQERFEAVVSLPSIQRTSGVSAIPMRADSLCSVRNKPSVKSHSWLMEGNLGVSRPGLRIDTGVSTSATSRFATAETPREIEDNIDHRVSNPRRGSFSSLPSLTASSASPVLTSPLTPPSSPTIETSENRLDSKEAWIEFSGRRIGFIEGIEDQERPKTKEPKPTGNNNFAIAEDPFERAKAFLFSLQGTKLFGRSSTWPVSKPEKLIRVRRQIPCTPYVTA